MGLNTNSVGLNSVPQHKNGHSEKTMEGLSQWVIKPLHNAIPHCHSPDFQCCVGNKSIPFFSFPLFPFFTSIFVQIWTLHRSTIWELVFNFILPMHMTVASNPFCDIQSKSAAFSSMFRCTFCIPEQMGNNQDEEILIIPNFESTLTSTST